MSQSHRTPGHQSPLPLETQLSDGMFPFELQLRPAFEPLVQVPLSPEPGLQPRSPLVTFESLRREAWGAS